MLKYGDLNSKFSKNNVRLTMATFEIAYMRNFAKISKLISFDTKCRYLKNLGSKFSKTNVRFEISTFGVVVH